VFSFCYVLVLSAQGQAEVLKQIVSPDAQPSFEVRHHLLHRIQQSDLKNGSSTLIGFMARGQVPLEMHKDEYLSLANDIYDKLLAEGGAAQSLLDHALAVIPEGERDFVWRDYCVQKLATTLSHPAVSSESVQQGLDLLKRLIDGQYPELQGTALIVASKLEATGMSHPHIALKPSHIGKQALSCASNADSPLLDRVTALQIAGRYLPQKTLTYASSLLDTDQHDTAVMLKVSAIATLGQIGNETHISLIQPYRRSMDIRLRKAARIAMQRLNS
jgi:hypothetical protein